MSDNFCRAFEKQHRGSRELIKSRLRVYLPFLEPLAGMYPDAEAIDLGCGRGEWLELMKEAGFKPYGVDLDEGMLSSCFELKLPAEKGDAIAFLAALPSESQAVVSAFHVVEHISFEQLRTVVSEAMRVLKPGGLLIMETPNPENLIVATTGFYLDPTHLRPIPPQLLLFLPEYFGFKRVTTLRLQESAELSGGKAQLTVLDVLGGVSPDYAVVAQKDADPKQMALFDAVFQKNYGLSLETLAQKYESQIATVETTIEKAATEAAAEARVQKSEVRVQQLQGELNVAQILLGEKSAVLANREATLAEQRANSQRLENEWNAAKIKIEEINQALQETLLRQHESQIATGKAETRAQQLQGELNTAQAQLAEKVATLADREATLAEQRANNQRLENEWNAAKIKIDELHQSNHRWWTLSESRQKELDEARAKIDALHQSNHHWWMSAERLGRELQAIHASRSMRWTAPLRWFDHQIKLLQDRGLASRMKALVKKTAGHLSSRSSCFAGKRPAIKIKAQGWLKKHRRLAREPEVVEIMPEQTQQKCVGMQQKVFAGGLLQITGVSHGEKWGRWSTSETVALEFEEPLPERFILHLTAKAFGPNIGKEFIAKTGESECRFTLKSLPETIQLEFDNPDGSRELKFDIPCPTAPADLSASADTRKLGLGLCQLEISVQGEVFHVNFLNRPNGCQKDAFHGKNQMTPRARQIHADLKAAIEHRRKETR